MLLEILLIGVGIAVVLWGADRFTDGACGLARKLNVSELVIGLTVVALGTIPAQARPSHLPCSLSPALALCRHKRNDCPLGRTPTCSFLQRLPLHGVQNGGEGQKGSPVLCGRNKEPVVSHSAHLCRYGSFGAWRSCSGGQCREGSL